MNVRSLYRIAMAIENILDDVVDERVTDETEVLEILIDAKRLCDLLGQELNNYIKRMAEGHPYEPDNVGRNVSRLSG